MHLYTSKYTPSGAEVHQTVVVTTSKYRVGHVEQPHRIEKLTRYDHMTYFEQSYRVENHEINTVGHVEPPIASTIINTD